MNDKINADRFSGFAGLYENVRPSVPDTACNILIDYLGKKPDTVVDLGCGTGLSTVVWEDKSEQIIGIDPSEDMLAEAKSKGNGHISFYQGFSDDTAFARSHCRYCVFTVFPLDGAQCKNSIWVCRFRSTSTAAGLRGRRQSNQGQRG